MAGASRRRAARLGRALATFCLVALVAGCAGSYERTMSGPSGTDAPERQSSGGGGSGGGGHGGY